MKKIYVLLTLVFLQLYSMAQQDAQYNLYQFNQLLINPAYAGARDGLSAMAATRQQWTGIDGAPQTNVLSVHNPFMDKNLGLGLTVVNDKIGPKSTFGIYGNVAYILKFSRVWKLSFGMNGGYNHNQFDASKITTQTMESTTQYTLNQVSNSLDVNSGFYLRSNDFFLGVSATHLNSPQIFNYEVKDGSINYKLKTHLFISAGKSLKFSDDLIFAPTVLFKLVNGQSSTDLNLNFLLFKKLWLGVFYRAGYGVGGLFQYYVTNTLRVSYSYDTGLQDARRLGPSHEIMIGMDIPAKKAKIVNPRFL